MNQKQTNNKKSNDALTFKQFYFLNEDNLILWGFFLFVLNIIYLAVLQIDSLLPSDQGSLFGFSWFLIVVHNLAVGMQTLSCRDLVP